MAGTNLLRIGGIVLLMAFAGATSSRGADFEAANRTFEAGQYDEARKSYQTLLDQGQRTANLFFNLANAEFRAGDFGRAVLNYERALALEPAHPEATRNLAVARERTGAKVPPSYWYGVLFPAWSTDVFAVTAAVAAWLAVIGFFVVRFSKRRSSIAAGLTVLATLVAAYTGAGLWHSERDRKLGIVTAKEAVARLAPADQSGVAGTLPAGSRVRVLSERGDWIYCELPGGGLGWLPSGDMERVRLPV